MTIILTLLVKVMKSYRICSVNNLLKMYIFNVRVFQGTYVEAIHDIPYRESSQIAQTVSALDMEADLVWENWGISLSYVEVSDRRI